MHHDTDLNCCQPIGASATGQSADHSTPWLRGIASRSVAAGIFWWLVFTSWFWWVTPIFLVGAIVSSALVVGFILGWRHDRASVR